MRAAQRFASLTLNFSILTADAGVGVAGAELKDGVLKTGFAAPVAQVPGTFGSQGDWYGYLQDGGG